MTYPKQPKDSIPENATPTLPIGASLSQITALVGSTVDGQRPIPPVDQWNPTFCGTMNLQVKSNGEWWHEGSKINREPLIRLFSSVLWREGDDYFLKTPVEKIQIQVDDVPLLVNSIDQVTLNIETDSETGIKTETKIDAKTYLRCTTKTGDVVIVDAAHPIFMRDYNGEARPYIRVRWDLEALIQRSAFYHLINYGEFVEREGHSRVALRSGDFEFEISAD